MSITFFFRFHLNFKLKFEHTFLKENNLLLQVVEQGKTMDVDKSEYNEVILETSASIELAPKFGKKEVKLLEELRADHVKQTTQHKFIVSVRKIKKTFS